MVDFRFRVKSGPAHTEIDVFAADGQESTGALCGTLTMRPGEAAAFLQLADSSLGRGRPVIVCLCGSTRFMDAYQEQMRRMSLEGKIVLSVAFTTSDVDDGFINETTSAQKTLLDELHLRKIDLADEVLVLNVGGYIGESTRKEIAYATSIGKPIHYLKPVIE